MNDVMADIAPTQTQKLAAEAVGTFVLVVLGVGAAVNSGEVTATGLSFGIAIVAMVYAFGRVSGGHFNPAVSVGAAISGRISWRDAGLYSAAQVVGGLVGGLVLVIIAVSAGIGYDFGDPIGANGYGDQGGYDLFAALLIEIVLTFIFLLVILSVTDERNEHPALAPLAIGLTLAAVHFVAITATGTSVNPARSIAVAFFSGSDAIIQLWLFILAPLLGAAIAGFAYPAIFGRVSEPVPGSGFTFTSTTAVPGYGAPDQFQQQWNQPGGYGQSDPAAQQAQGGYAATGYAAQQTEQPIIQDGWQWDPQAQQWIPAQQQPPAQQAQPQDQGWASPSDDGQTQVRPPDGH